jgi:hypothetical protein
MDYLQRPIAKSVVLPSWFVESAAGETGAPTKCAMYASYSISRVLNQLGSYK